MSPRKGTAEEQEQRDYYTKLRSVLRRAWLKYPERYIAINNARRDYKGPNKRLKYEYQCAMCLNWFQWLAKKAARKVGKIGLAIDHIIPCGSLLCKNDVGGFVLRLFCKADGLQVLCDVCHDTIKSKQDREDRKK